MTSRILDQLPAELLGDDLEADRPVLDERVVTGAWIVFIEGETDFRNPGKHRTTERQAEDLVWAVHNN